MMTNETTQTRTGGSQQEATSPAELRKYRLRTRLPWSRLRRGVHTRPMIDLDLDLTIEDLMADLDPGWLMRRDDTVSTDDTP